MDALTLEVLAVHDPKAPLRFWSRSSFMHAGCLLARIKALPTADVIVLELWEEVTPRKSYRCAVCGRPIRRA